MRMITRKELTGLVLAGGRGRRMQGAAGLQTSETSPVHEKGLLQLHGLPLVEHARRHLAPYVGQMLISANTHLDAYAEYGFVVPDDNVLGEYPGPLAGIASALKHVTTPWMIVLPVDVPHPPVDLVDLLCDAVGVDSAQIAYATTENGVHPLCMLLHTSLMRNLYGFLLSGERKVQCWQWQNNAVAVRFEGAAFFNINTPQDLLRAG